MRVRSPGTFRLRQVVFRSLTAAFALGAALVMASSARAQNAGNQAAAEALFDQGKAEMAAERYAAACPKFFESNRLDEGIGTSLWLADCYEKNGQTASAWAEFREAAALAVKSGDPREKVARERSQSLERKLARLVLIVPTASRLPGLRIARDGGEVGLPLWGSSVPADPGRHSVVVSAPDHRPVTLTVEVLPGPGEQALVVPVLADAPPTPAEAVVVAPPAAAVMSPDPVGQPIQRVAAIAAGAVGMVSIALASYFGLHAGAELDDSNADHHCQAHNLCDATGVADRASAQSSAAISTALFVVGGAALAGGGVLWLTTPHGASGPAKAGGTAPTARATRVLPWLDPRGAGVVLGADF
jgi:serine/threonine-protein kinase